MLSFVFIQLTIFSNFVYFRNTLNKILLHLLLKFNILIYFPLYLDRNASISIANSTRLLCIKWTTAAVFDGDLYRSLRGMKLDIWKSFLVFDEFESAGIGHRVDIFLKFYKYELAQIVCVIFKWKVLIFFLYFYEGWKKVDQKVYFLNILWTTYF